MKRLAAGLAFLATACSTGSAGGAGYAAGDGVGRTGGREPVRYASPSRIVAAEIALTQLARRKGERTARLETAADDAILFVPQAVPARDWLKARKDDGAMSLNREPHQVWMSCDGSLAATYGAWHGEAARTTGYFLTVWQRQGNGEYKWVMDQRDALASPIQAPEMIGASVASCDSLPPVAQVVEPIRGDVRGASSKDRSLTWSVRVDTWCGRIVNIKVFRGAGKQMETVLTKQVEPSLGEDGRPSASCVRP